MNRDHPAPEPGILVCFAVPEEARPFRELAGAHPGVRVLVTGMGRRNAVVGVESALAQARPALVITGGFAGGLNPDLAPGTVLFDADPNFPLAARLQSAGAQPARFFCADHVATTAVEKAKLRQSTGADAVEMESGAIRELCRARQIPSATVRVILDAAGVDLPLDFNAVMTPDQKISGRKLALAVAASPGRIPALLRLQKQGAAASLSLAKVLQVAL